MQRAITPTMSLTVAYVGNKGTHTLGDGDSNRTNPNEAVVNLPGAYSVTGQTLHYDPSVPANTITATAAPHRLTTSCSAITVAASPHAEMPTTQLQPSLHPAPVCAAGRTASLTEATTRTQNSMLCKSHWRSSIATGLPVTGKLSVGQPLTTPQPLDLEPQSHSPA